MLKLFRVYISDKRLPGRICSAAVLQSMMLGFLRSASAASSAASNEPWLRDWLEANDAVLGVREHMADSAHAYRAQLASLGALDLSSKRYPNIEVLYRQASLLVTDYSSCAIDFMLTGRPSVSFAYDLEHYAGTERGLFYDLEHVFPGPVCRDFAQLATTLDAFGKGRQVVPADLDLRRQTFFDFDDDGSAWRVASRVRSLALDGEPRMARC